MSDLLREQVQQTKKALEAPIPDLDSLVQLLAPPLRFLGLYTGTIQSDQALNSDDAHDEAQQPFSPWDALDPALRPTFIQKHLPGLQWTLLRTIYVDWKEQLEDTGQLQSVFEPWFSPTVESNEAHLVALSAVSVILALFKEQQQRPQSAALHRFSLQYALQSLSLSTTTRHPLDALCHATFRPRFIQNSSTVRSKAQMEWLNTLRLFFSVPDRVANLQAETDPGPSLQVPPSLEWSAYMAHLTQAFLRLLLLVVSSSSEPPSAQHVVPDAAAPFLAKLVNNGFIATSSRASSFWSVALPRLWPQLCDPSQQCSSASLWRSTMSHLVSRDVERLQSSLMSELLTMDQVLKPLVPHPYATGQKDRNTVVASARLFVDLFGPCAGPATAVFVDRDGWPVCVARLLAAWAQATDTLEAVMHHITSAWSDKTSVERASPAYRAYLTLALLLCVAHMPEQSRSLATFSSSEAFLSGVQAHLSTTRMDVRFQGMLVAEMVSQRSLGSCGDATKPLDFGAEVWRGTQPGLDVCRQLRALAAGPTDLERVPLATAQPPVLSSPKEDTEKSTTSMRSASWLGSAKNPRSVPSTPDKTTTPHPPPPPAKSNKNKITVLQSQTLQDDSDDDDDDDLAPYAMPEETAEELSENEDLSAYTPAKNKPKPPVYMADLTGYLKDAENADKIEMGLQHAASLIRKRAHWGTELAEHAVDLTFALISLHNNFDLDHFAQQRQDALIALVSSSPQEAAPTIIEQYYTPHYSVDQRFAMLTALALSARELSNLELPAAVGAGGTFPSKQLPPALHAKLVEFEAGPFANSSLDGLAQDLASSALQNIRQESSAQYGPTDAERQENLLSVQSTKVQAQTRSSSALSKKKKQATSSAQSHRYAQLAEGSFIMPLVNRMWVTLHHAVNTNDSLFLPLLLGRYFATLSVLVHAASHAPALRRMLPEVLGLTLALRGVSDEDDVVASQMELVVICLQAASDGSVERLLMRDMDTRELVFRAKTWAESVWRQEEGKGTGTNMGRLGRNAAGVLLRCDSLAMLS